MISKKPSYLNFDKENYPWKSTIDYRKDPEKYLVGKGEQGVLICEPYKSEIGKYWRFKTQEIAHESSDKIYLMFLDYLQNNDFVGADMARKFLQMGYTRARRYANYKSGRKYDKDHDYQQFPRGTGEEEKARAAKIFYEKWQLAKSNEKYLEMKKKWQERIG
ncbi:MAG: hypothetical protein K0R25_1225 [Rickettsiaceae bacterium]|jgi:hypothetical protein|nr:hypothetical protein [Rickettsiaceae bacterium]